MEGVALMEEMLELGWIEVQGDEFHAPVRLTSNGSAAMARLGIDADGLAIKKRKFAFACLDWTERRFHLGGALGGAAFRVLEKHGYVKRSPDSRKGGRLTPVGDWLRLPSPGP